LYFSAISLLVWAYFHPSFMSFLCRAQTTMSCYVMNFESLLLKELPPNGMTKPLNAIIGVANFSVNFHLQRKKGRNLLQPFRIFIGQVAIKWKVPRGIIGVAKFSVNLVSLTKFQVQYAIGNDDEERQLTS